MNKTILNNFTRFCIVALLLLCVGTHAMANDGVIITLKDGQELSFKFSSKPRIYFGSELTITAPDSTTVSYEYTEVRSVRYGTLTPTGIEDTPSDETSNISFKIVNGTLYVYGLPVNERVSIYNIAGQRIASQSQTNDGDVLTITLNSHGVVVVRTSTGISYKILVP